MRQTTLERPFSHCTCAFTSCHSTPLRTVRYIPINSKIGKGRLSRVGVVADRDTPVAPSLSIGRRPRKRRAASLYHPLRVVRYAIDQYSVPTRAKTERPESARERAPPDSFPDGIKILYDCPDAALDICFVHGLTGDRDNTWTARGQSVPWPRTLLPPRLSKASILTYGYDAYVVRGSGASVNGLTSHAANLLNDLTTNRASRHASNRPLLFVAHSLGGLLCKEAILLSRNHPESHLRGVFDCTKGVAFMGTPHGGSWMANWASIPASLLGVAKSTNKSLLEILKTDDQFLESIQVRFLSMVRELREAGGCFEITCFFEELPLPMVGIVVSRESATLQGYSSFSIHADHRDMVRFRSAEDNGFVRLFGELTRWESQIRESATNPSAWPAGEAQADTASTSLFCNYGSGNQNNALGGTQYNNTGSGNQVFGDFSGPVSFS